MLKFNALQVLSVVPEADDAVAIAIQVPAALQEQYRGSAGQHVVLRAQLDGEELRRSYSLLNAPGEWPLRIAPRVHASGRMSRHLAEELKPGQQIEVLPPNGSFTPRAVTAGARYVVFAAGCGITPVVSVMRSLLAAGAQVLLFYGNTASARAMCVEELLGLKDQHMQRLALHFVMSREPQEVELYNGRLDAARVREFAGALFDPVAVAEYFVCGPGDMIGQVGAALRALGVDPGRIHAEHFVSAEAGPGHTRTGLIPAVLPAAGEPLHAADNAQVSVTMDGRRRSFSMRINDETVLDAAARQGIELPFSCRAGVCSTCRTKVIAGEVQMAQNYALEDWELAQGYVLACQSRCKTATLELDYDEK